MNTDDTTAAEVRGWLEGVPVPPCELRPDRLAGAGRDRVRRRTRLRTAGGAVAAVAVLTAAAPVATDLLRSAKRPATGSAASSAPAAPTSSAPASPAAPAACTVAPLTPPAGLTARGVRDGQSVHIEGIDPSGRYVIGSTYGGFNSSPVGVLWDGATARILPTPTGWEYVMPEAVTAAGVVVGSGSEPGGRFFGWVYRGGTVTRLTLPNGYVEALGVFVNAAGDIVASVQTADHKTDAVARWAAGRPGSPELLPPAPGKGGVFAAGIADDGTVIGAAGGTEGAFRWSRAGGWSPLQAGVAETRVTAVRDVRVIGTARTTNTLWNLRTGAVTELSLPGGLFPAGKQPGTITDVAPTGEIVVGPGQDGSGWLVRAGRSWALPVPRSDTRPAPVAVDDTGHVVAGNAYRDPTSPDGIWLPVRWTC